MSERRSRGFTLVELLVVIGIIAVLISILLPALSSARRAATAAKCAATLREIGNGFQMYAQYNKGYLPPAQLTPASGQTYVVEGISYPVATGSLSTNAMWTAFVARYVGNAKNGGMAYASGGNNAAADAFIARTKSVLWCPSWDGYDRGSVDVGTVMWQTGYGMNMYPTMDVDRTLMPPGADQFWIQGWSNTTGTWTTGKWYKISQYKKPGDRCLVADSQFWQVWANESNTNRTFPGQKLLSNSTTWSAAAAQAKYQTFFDWYRHGKYPNVAVQGSDGYFNPNGGKVSYNILYCDGHVAISADRSESYRSIRMRYPG